MFQVVASVLPKELSSSSGLELVDENFLHVLDILHLVLFLGYNYYSDFFGVLHDIIEQFFELILVLEH